MLYAPVIFIVNLKDAYVIPQITAVVTKKIFGAAV